MSHIVDQIKERLKARSGKEYWRSLEELADTPEFQEMLHREFPEGASEWGDGFSRRGFLKLMGASLALAGATACTRQPAEKIVPYVRQPEEIIPGRPLYFAGAATLGGYATGVLVESHMGRPTKIEGNPDHPASLGATDIFAQASVLEMYDPDRSQALTYLGNISSWAAFLARLNECMIVHRKYPTPGDGLRILTESVTSPTLAAQLQEILTALPGAKWHQWEPVNRDNVLAGARMAFGEPVSTHYNFRNADIIVSLDSDFLNYGPGTVRYARDFAARRKVEGGKMNRLYTIESTTTNTGAMADHRFARKAGEIGGIAQALLNAVRGTSTGIEKWIAVIAKDLAANPGAGIVIAGDHQPAEVHAAAHAINELLGNAGKTVFYTDPVEADPSARLQSLRLLVDDMNRSQVETLIILGGNPVYNAPSDLKFAEALSRVGTRMHVGLYDDETSYLCHWHIPQAHALESWSDARAYDGTVTLIQPLIAPLYGGKTFHEILAAMMGSDRSGYTIVQDYWKKLHPENFDHFWRKSLHDGLVEGSAFPPKTVTAKADLPPAATGSGEGLEIQFRPDPTIYDGRYSNLGWLQELPKPMTKITWDNTVLVSPMTAKRFALSAEDVVELNYKGRKVTGPIWILAGQPDDSITVHFGYGRTRAGRVGTGAGFNAYSLQTAGAPCYDSGLELRKTGSKYQLASTQMHQMMEGRHLVRSAELDEYLQHPDFAREVEETPADDMTMYPPYKHDGYAWGMTIDLNACVGCNACVVACVSENNIAVVGKDQVRRGREMHWIRVDRYFKGELEDPEIYHQPVPCMQCENAPCEVVCPVNATTHSAEGLNDMVYNRCIGTRYCSNNCPYKVRRFNFFLYSDLQSPSLKLQRNPDVTVRTRGVMEKCTYCVQRINHARIEAEKENRTVRDGEITTACQQVCPAEAIVFGNIHDPESRVSLLKKEERNYGLLADLNTRPRTTYMANLKNPNPELKEG